MSKQTIELRGVATGAMLQTLRGHQGEILALAFSPTAPILASSDWNGAIRVSDVATGACLQILRAEGPYAGMDITGATGLSDGQRASLRALGAVEGA
jgi:WD40 repeat protein